MSEQELFEKWARPDSVQMHRNPETGEYTERGMSAAWAGWMASVKAHREAGHSKATDDVVAERRRQIEAEGWTPEHDDEHDSGELADVAACYALGVYSDRADAGVPGDIPPYWPQSWDESWWRPKDRRRNLVRAAALLIAEIERLDRAALKTPND